MQNFFTITGQIKSREKCVTKAGKDFIKLTVETQRGKYTEDVVIAVWKTSFDIVNKIPDLAMVTAVGYLAGEYHRAQEVVHRIDLSAPVKQNQENTEELPPFEPENEPF